MNNTPFDCEVHVQGPGGGATFNLPPGGSTQMSMGSPGNKVVMAWNNQTGQVVCCYPIDVGQTGFDRFYGLGMNYEGNGQWQCVPPPPPQDPCQRPCNGATDPNTVSIGGPIFVP